VTLTKEQLTAHLRRLRSYLLVVPPVPRERWFYKRGPWRPKPTPGIVYIEAAEVEEVPSPAAPAVVEEEVVEYEKISIATAATHVIIPARLGKRIKIHFLTFTVGGEVNITLWDGSEAISGAMDFGGTSEPRGIVMPPDGKSLRLNLSTAFKIQLSAAVQVSGFVLFSYVD